VLLVIGGWAAVIYGAASVFGGKKEARPITQEDQDMDAAVAQLEKDNAAAAAVAPKK